MARYIHDPMNPSLPPRRAPSTLQRLRSAGLVIMRREHPYYQCVGAARGVMIYQRPGIFYWFDDEGGSGAGSTPKKAISFRLGLGDVIDNNRQMKSYCRLILGAPESMTNETLWRTQAACYEELRSKRR